MSAYLITFLLFALYLVIIPIGISPFETPKVILAEAVIDILLFVKIFKFKRGDFKHLISTPQILFIGILFILSLDTQFLFQPKGAFFGNVFRLQGQFLFWHLLLFSLLSNNIRLVKIPHFLYYFSFIGLCLSTLILGVNQNNRAFGTLGEPNALSATVLFIFPFIFFKFRPLGFISLITTFLLILLSGSRAGLIGLMIEMLFMILIKVKFSTAKATIISFLIIIITLISPWIDKQGWFENRAQIWETAFKAGLASPFIGHGFGNIQATIHQQAILLNNNVQYQIVDSSHNFLLDFWIQGGLVGVVSILLLVFLTLKHFVKSRKLLETTAFLGLVTAMLFNPVSVVNLLAFWWLIGQGFDNHHSIS